MQYAGYVDFLLFFQRPGGGPVIELVPDPDSVIYVWEMTVQIRSACP